MHDFTCGWWKGVGLRLVFNAISPAGARVPITSYVCTQPNGPEQLSPNNNDPCSVSRGLRECSIKESVIPLLLDGVVKSASDTLYAWAVYTNPFVVLDIPQGWCVGSVVMTFQVNIPALSLSVHTSERLSNNTDRTVFSVVSEEAEIPVVVNFTTLACGRYLRINMTSARVLYLAEIEVSDTGKCRTYACQCDELHPGLLVWSAVILHILCLLTPPTGLMSTQHTLW